MKVLLLNGSPHLKGCTYTALLEVSKTLQEEGVETDIFQIGNAVIAACKACFLCEKLGRCAIDDKVNEFLDAAEKSDGFIFGTPVHYAAPSGSIVPFLHRAFFANFLSGRNVFRLKPGAAVVSARRGGTTSAFDQLNKYFTISEMPVISSQYWNNVHGMNPDEVLKDMEGMQIMRTLGRNMAYHLKCKEAAEKAGIRPPQKEKPISTNFI